MLPSLTEKDLKPYFDQPEMIKQTAEQLKKDMEQFGEEINFSGNIATAYSELFTQTQPFIQKLIDTNYQKLLQVLYRIDVSEKMISAAVNEGNEISSVITRLILFRELQKVVIRNHYGK